MEIVTVVIIIAATLIAAAALFGTVLFRFTVSELKRKCTLIDRLLDSSNDYRVDWNSDFSYVKFSDETVASLHQWGIEPDADYLRSIFAPSEQFGPVDDTELVMNALKDGGVTTRMNYTGGITGIVRWQSEMLPEKNGVNRIITVGRDISDASVSRNVMDKFKEQYCRQHDFFNVLENNAELSEFVLEIEGNEIESVSLSKEMRRTLGFDEESRISSDDILALVKKEYALPFQRSINKLAVGISERISQTIELKTTGGRYRTYLLRCKRYENGSENRIIGALVDITDVEMCRQSEDLELQIDAQTGLFNRSGFMRSGSRFLEAANESGAPCAVVCIQIARLQKIITLFGIDVADMLMRLYAETLSGCAPQGSVVGKVGVEDFAMLISCGNRSEIDKLIKEISIIIENNCNNKVLPSVLKEQSRFIAGACFYDGKDDIATLYNKASVTLFNGSRYTGNVCCYFDTAIERKVCERDIVEQEIGEALKHGELELYYQPKISFCTGEIVGVEALMRWNHRTQGLIMPGDFIPVAEEIGIITKIDEWGLVQSCIQAKRWQEKGYPPVKVSVNMSQAQLYQTDVVETVRTALKDSGLDPQWLEVELTETMAMLDIERTVSVLSQIQKLGVSVSMDDFGTGYSSLSSLKILPINTIKIDRGLVYDIETNETARYIAKAIVELGKAMKLNILAEGVETEGQRVLLETLGCDVAQGYLYSKPEPAAVIEKRFLVPAMKKQA